MSIPSATPPTNPNPPSIQPQTSVSAPAETTSWMDPTGAWQKFLGPTATPQDVQMFLQSLLKTFATQIQQDDAQMKKEAERQKRIIEGEDE